MHTFPLYLLDSGDPEEFKEIAALAKQTNFSLWGATTNPTLIAKKLAGQKISMQKAYDLQKQIVMDIVGLVPGAVSAEVYADTNTTAEEMINQGLDIATWHERVVVKLPTTIEGFKARTALRRKNIPVNNTLVFSQEQIFAICLHERIMKSEGATDKDWPSFISPFVGRLDDQHIDGMQLVEHGMKMKQTHGFDLWMLEASVRTLEHMQRGVDIKTELITAPAKIYREWFTKEIQDSRFKIQESKTDLRAIPYWEPSKELLAITTEAAFMDAITSEKLNIQHYLTDKGIIRFAEDWKSIIE